jgi:hypothetical protein
MQEAAIYAFPLLAALIFAGMPVRVALPATLVAGYLLLPAGYRFDLPLLPAITKTTVTAFSALFLSLVVLGSQRQGPRAVAAPEAGGARPVGWLPRPWWARLLLAAFVISPAFTGLLNGDPIPVQGRVVPGISLYDGLSMSQSAIISVIPLLLARYLLAGEDAHRAILLVLGVAGLLYSLPTLVEIRLSPQLSTWIYGYFPHSWLQHVRGDGYRPVVFLRHALRLSLFLCCALLALLAYMRASDGDRRILFFAGAAYLGIVLVFAKSLGMMLVAAALSPVLLLGGVRLQIAVAAAIAVLVVSYPAMRMSGLSPFGPVSAALEQVSPTRAASLRFRLDQEDALIGHANERMLFGWGEYGRGTAVDERPETGSIRDGVWLIRYGETGAVGLVSLFGLLALPLIALAARARHHQIGIATSGLAVVVAANLLDLIPNSGLTPVTFMLAGALLGRLELVRQEQPGAAEPAGRGMHVPRRAKAARRPATAGDAPAGEEPTGKELPARRGASAGSRPRYSRYAARRKRHA